MRLRFRRSSRPRREFDQPVFAVRVECPKHLIEIDGGEPLAVIRIARVLQLQQVGTQTRETLRGFDDLCAERGNFAVDDGLDDGEHARGTARGDDRGRGLLLTARGVGEIRAIREQQLAADRSEGRRALGIDVGQQRRQATFADGFVALRFQQPGECVMRVRGWGLGSGREGGRRFKPHGDEMLLGQDEADRRRLRIVGVGAIDQGRAEKQRAIHRP